MNNEINSLELLVVEEDLTRKQIKDYKIYRGNDSIWVSYNQINAYYIFNSKCELVDVQID